MKLKRGTRARITLTDGTTLEGTVRFTFSWWTWRLSEVEVHARQGSVTAAGYFLVPKRSALFVQVEE